MIRRLTFLTSILLLAPVATPCHATASGRVASAPDGAAAERVPARRVDPSECDGLIDLHVHLECQAQAHGARWYGSTEECAGGRAILPCDGEEDHFVADRFTPPSGTFVPHRIRYVLWNGVDPFAPAGQAPCDVGLDHHVELLLGSRARPDATPVVLDSWEVRARAEPAGAVVYELTRHASYAARAGEYLYISIQHAGDVSAGPSCRGRLGSSICTLGCPVSETDAAFWSQGGAPPFTWADLRTFGIRQRPTTAVFGYVVP